MKIAQCVRARLYEHSTWLLYLTKIKVLIFILDYLNYFAIQTLVCSFFRYLLCASGDYVKVYSTATEECIHILQGHTNLVTGIQLNPQNHLQVTNLL